MGRIFPLITTAKRRSTPNQPLQPTGAAVSVSGSSMLTAPAAAAVMFVALIFPMDTKLIILKRLDEICRGNRLNDLGEIQWSDGQLLRSCTIRAERGDPNGWRSFIEHLQAHRDVAWGFRRILEELGWAAYSVEHDRLLLTLPNDFPALTESVAAQLLNVLDPELESKDAEPSPHAESLGAIMYIEEKPGLAGHGRIGRVRFSASRKTIYYAGRKLRSLKGSGYKANYFNIETGLHYWVSNCRKDGNDTLYPGVVEIDEDAREEYWTRIRQLPENVHMTRFRSEGKHAKRRPS